MNQNHARKLFRLLLTCSGMALMCMAIGCASKKHLAGKDTPGSPPELTAAETYDQIIHPIMVRSCTPCHFPEFGKKKMLNTFDSVATSINDILVRIQLPASDEKFMPFKSKKPHLTDAEIAAFKQWASKLEG